MIQQNSALVEEVPAAAASLEDLAGKLAEVVSAFKLEGCGLQATGGASSIPEWHGYPEGLKAKPKTKTALSLVARPKKLAVAGGKEEWEAF